MVFRYPGEARVTAYLQRDTRLCPLEDFNASGFLFAPFRPEAPPILLTPDSIHCSEAFNRQVRNDFDPLFVQQPEDEKERYVQLVNKAKDAITQGKFRKVVLSRKREIAHRSSPFTTFDTLLELYPHAFCYLWFHPETGFWMGASPELLLHAGEGTFATASLAGTLKYIEGEEPLWGEKEREEQAWVTRFIREELRYKVAKIKVTDPGTTRAGSMVHLQTIISGSLGNCSLETLIRTLHPTPAVCGYPKREALKFILGSEGYDRHYYTGYLGTLNMKDKPAAADGPNARLYVNLRCMRFSREKASIYVGGGVTAGSDATAEWQETLEKEATMLRVLYNSVE